MSTIQMRPTFELETNLDKREVINRIKTMFLNCPGDDSSVEYNGQFVDDHAMISVGDSHRHFWSPWLNLEIHDNEKLRRRISCRFSPHPSIWTAFIFAYLGISVFVFFAAMLGISQQLAGQPPLAYATIPIGLAVAAMLWIASRIGQRLASAEMFEMKRKLEECLRYD